MNSVEVSLQITMTNSKRAKHTKRDWDIKFLYKNKNTKYFGETLEKIGQAEDYRVRLTPKKACQ